MRAPRLRIFVMAVALLEYARNSIVRTQGASGGMDGKRLEQESGRDRIHRWNWILTGLQVQVGAM